MSREALRRQLQEPELPRQLPQVIGMMTTPEFCFAPSIVASVSYGAGLP